MEVVFNIFTEFRLKAAFVPLESQSQMYTQQWKAIPKPILMFSLNVSELGQTRKPLRSLF